MNLRVRDFAAAVLSGLSIAVLYFLVAALLEALMPRTPAYALATGAAAGLALPVRALVRRWMIWGPLALPVPAHIVEDFALTSLEAESPEIMAMAFREAARQVLGPLEMTVYLRSGDYLDAILHEGKAPTSVPVSSFAPERGGNTRLLSTPEVPELGGAYGLVLLESDHDIMGAVSIGTSRPLAGAHREILVGLCREFAQGLRAMELFAELASVERLARDLEIAREVESGFLSRPLPPVRGIQIAARTLLSREVGGDFFDLIEVEEGRVGLLVGDVTGRGIGAALLMAMTLSFFRSLVPGASSPRQVLEEVNHLIMRHRPSGKAYVAATYGVYDCRDKTLTLANAGMPPPTLNGRPLALKGLPLGARASAAFREEKIPLTSGDVLVLMSDGLNAKNSKGQKLGWERLFRLVGDHTALSAEGLLDHLLRATTKWTGGHPHDDLTAICLKVGEGGGRQLKRAAARNTRKLAKSEKA